MLALFLAFLLAPQSVSYQGHDTSDVGGAGGGGGGPSGVRRVEVPYKGVGDMTGTRPNVLLVVADDLGADLVGSYGLGAAPPCTPNVDQLAADGVLFRSAWASPICSPARAQLMTGRFGFRTGIGRNVGAGLESYGLQGEELTLPELLLGYQSVAVGKWHLAAQTDSPLHPNFSGFAAFSGSLFNLSHLNGDYWNWHKTIDGVSAFTDRYATNDVVNDAIAAMQSLPEPWFVLVGLHAPHSPFHAPPPNLCGNSCGTSYCGQLPGLPSVAEFVKAMTESMDTELGRLLANARDLDPQALIVFVGDNGTATAAVEPPYLPGRGKGTLYESGVQVPLVIDGPGIAPGVCDAPVGIVDLYATLAQLAGVASPAADSVSLVPYLQDPTRPPLRETIFAEHFSPNGPGPYDYHDYAIRNRRFKLIRVEGQPDELYDLVADPFEAADLVPTLVPGSEAEAAYLELSQALVDLLAS